MHGKAPLHDEGEIALIDAREEGVFARRHLLLASCVPLGRLGGVAQGIGWALNEEYVYDQDGRLENAGFLYYRVPVCSDLPMIDAILVEVPYPRHPFGARGVGEVPIVPPMAAVTNAIADATGLRLRDLPMSPPNCARRSTSTPRRGSLPNSSHFTRRSPSASGRSCECARRINRLVLSSPFVAAYVID
jgi:hypothetical protein